IIGKEIGFQVKKNLSLSVIDPYKIWNSNASLFRISQDRACLPIHFIENRKLLCLVQDNLICICFSQINRYFVDLKINLCLVLIKFLMPDLQRTYQFDIKFRSRDKSGSALFNKAQ